MGCSFLGLPPALSSPAPIYTPGWPERGTVRVKCLAQEHNKMSPATPAPARTARSGVERTNHEATLLPDITRDTPKFDKVLIHSNWSSLRGTYWAKFQQTKTYWFVNHIFWGISDAISSMLHLQDQRSIYARVLHAMAQFVLKIEKCPTS